MTVIIREASLKDIPRLVDFQLRMAFETEKLTLDIATLTLGVQQLLRNPSKGKYYVAIAGEEITGCLLTTFEWSDWRDGTVLWIQSVYVESGFRRQGIYTALYEHVRNLVSADPGLKGIRLYVDRANIPAQDVYRKLGMNGDHYQVFEWMKS